MGFTGKRALQFKMMYINEFNRMEEELKKASENRILHNENKSSPLENIV
ncbi:antirepressor [Bacillus cereus]|nr:antirepressor [Bacillus cereus]